MVDAGTLFMEPGTVVYLQGSSISTFTNGKIEANNVHITFDANNGNAAMNLESGGNRFDNVVFDSQGESPYSYGFSAKIRMGFGNNFTGCDFYPAVQAQIIGYNTAPQNRFFGCSFFHGFSNNQYVERSVVTKSKFSNMTSSLSVAQSTVSDSEFRNIELLYSISSVLRNNVFINVKSIYSSGMIEDNIFTDGSNLDIRGDGRLEMTGNYFYNLASVNIYLDQGYPTNYKVVNNVFDLTQLMIRSPSYYGALPRINATDNYWNGVGYTSQIYDYRNDVNRALFIVSPEKTSYKLPKYLRDYYQIITNDTMCHGYSYEDSMVCSGHGSCVNVDDCWCDEGYTGSLCDVPICYGELASNSSVCSGNGVCIAPQSCQCGSEYTGLKCQVNRCAWTITGFGAPTPVTTAAWNDTGVSFEINMQTNPQNPNIMHYITMVPFSGDMDIFTENPFTQIPTISGCYKRYHLNVAWNSSDLVHSFNPSSQIMEMSTKIHLHYVDTVAGTVVSFEYSQKIYATMYSHAVSVFNTNAVEIAKLRVKSIFPQSTAIVIIGDMTVLSGHTLNSMELVSATAGSGFNLNYTPNSQNSYDFRIVSKAGQQSVTGKYYFDADISQDGVSTTYTLEIDVTYSIIIPAPLPNITYPTVVTITDEFGAPKMTFETGETAYLSTMLASFSPKLRNAQSLQIENVYLCCMKNNGPMPQYNPSAGKYGCTVYNPSTMDKWMQLVSDGNASSTATVIPSSDPSSASASFDVSPLTDKDRVCYIHVHTAVQTLHSRALHVAKGEEESHNYAVFRAVESSNISAASDPNHHLAFWLCFVTSISMFVFML